MLHLPRVGWTPLACENGAFPDWIIVVAVVACCCVLLRVVVVSREYSLYAHAHVPSHLEVKLPATPSTPALDNAHEKLRAIEGAKKIQK